MYWVTCGLQCNELLTSMASLSSRSLEGPYHLALQLLQLLLLPELPPPPAPSPPPPRSHTHYTHTTYHDYHDTLIRSCLSCRWSASVARAKISQRLHCHMPSIAAPMVDDGWIPALIKVVIIMHCGFTVAAHHWTCNTHTSHLNRCTCCMSMPASHETHSLGVMTHHKYTA